MTTCRVVCRVAIFIGTFVTFFYVGLLFKLALLRIGTLTEDSSAAKVYETMPFDIRQNVYVFNITNKEEFLSGAKPKFKQLGPYTFNLSLHKDISWAANGSLVYKERRIFTFVPELSAGNLTDIVCTVDPVYAFVQSVFDTLSSSTQKYLKWLLSSRSILFEHTVDEILYSGYPDAIANLAHLFKHDLPVINGRIGYLRALNNSDDGELTVFSGQNNTLKKRTEVYRWRGNETIPYYGEPCNKLYGTNGELFPAFAPWEPAPQIDVFQPMFCKPWTLYLNESVNSSGVELAKYNTRDDMFSPTGNTKFDRCLQPNGWLKGIFDISNCQHGFPALVSLPHFFRAEECLKDVEGLKPDVKLHDFEIDISPVFGIPVRPALRAQINVRVRRKFSSDSPEIVYPVLWQEIVLAEHESQSLSSMIYYATTVPEFSLSAILWVTAGITFYFLLQDWRSYRRISETSEEDEQPIWSPADDLETDQAAQDNNEVLSSPRSY